MIKKKSKLIAISVTLICLAPIIARNQSTFFLGEPQIPDKVKMH